MRTGCHSGLSFVEPQLGASLIIDGRLCDVVNIMPGGNVFIADVISGNRRWIDYFTAEVIDPHQNPEALLEALGALDDEGAA